jgi:hypothetical protein
MGLLSKVIAISDKDETRDALNDDSINASHDHTDSAEDIINTYFDESGPFNCCLFQASIDDINKSILQSINEFGKLLSLQENTLMLMFPLSIDHELLIHHLNKHFELNVVEQFSADTPQKVIESIQKYVSA